MDLPKILLTGLFFLFFLVFLEFLDSWAWDSKNLEKNQINQKKQKRQSWMDLPKILLTGLFFLFFFFLVFLQFLDSWAWDSKNLEKNQINQKKQKKQSGIDLLQILLTGLFFLFLFGFPWLFGHMERWTWKKGKKHEKTKDAKTQRSQRPFLFFFLGGWVCKDDVKQTYHRNTPVMFWKRFEMLYVNGDLNRNIFPKWWCHGDWTPWLLDFLVGGWTNPFEKYARQNGNFPQGSGWKLNKYLKPPPRYARWPC